MSTLTDSGFPTLKNILSVLNPDKSIADMVDLLSKKTPMLEDIPWKQANGVTGHLITNENVLPTPTWRGFNEGVAATKGETIQYTETCGMLEDRSDVDVKLAAVSGDVAGYRFTQDRMKVESFGQTFESAVLYENALTNPKRIHGLSQRYPATTGYTSSSYVLKPGTNSGNNCRSIWLLNWNQDRLYGIYPQGSVAGLQKSDKGEWYTTAPVGGNQMLVYRTQFNWDCGIAVEDYRYSCRFQWDPDDSAGGFASSGKGIYLGMSDMIATVYDMQATSARFYMDRVSFALLQKQLASNTTNYLEWVDHGGRFLPVFLGVPIRITDSLVAETAIS